MRQVIRGRAYDTGTSREIARSDYGEAGDEMGSQARWILFQTKGGVFFEASVDHDGSPQPIQPLSKAEAKSWLQKNACHLVEEHFGRAPEASTRRSASSGVAAALNEKVALWNFNTVSRDLSRARIGAQADPEDALTAACSLLESMCRSILLELRLPLPAKKGIDGLLNAVQEPLGLSPGRPEIGDDVRQILGGLTTVVKGVGALRTHGGDAHGRERGFCPIDVRIARLAIDAASSIALFLIETWEMEKDRPLPLHA